MAEAAAMLYAVQRLLLAVPCLYLSYALVNVWLDPMAWDQGRWVPYAVGILLVEFLVIHAGVLITNMAATQTGFARKMKLFVGLAAMYLLMGLGFALSTDSMSLLLILVGVMVSRFLAALNADPAGRKRQQARSGFAAVIYLGAVFATLFLPIPEFGITNTVLAEVYPQRGGGVWEREPERAIAAGACYFGVLGIAELCWPQKDKDQRPAIVDNPNG
ncbi:MAG: hypothetical protein RJQ07_05590 [Pseudomonadales bacterium]